MLFVAFKPLDLKKQAHFPPLILKINDELLNTKVLQFKQKVHEHFKPYISPFMNEQNLKLSCKQAESMINTMPLYMYIDPNQYTQYVQCTTQPNSPDEEQQRWKFAKNLLICKLPHELNLKSIPQKDQNSIENVIKKAKLGDEKIKMIINGKIVEKNCSQNWPKFVSDHWKEFALQNECIYAKFISVKLE